MTIKCMTCACMSQHIMIPLDVGYSKLSDEAKCHDNLARRNNAMDSSQTANHDNLKQSILIQCIRVINVR